jgi:NitT/TauT family transport system substrate-binding protein
MKMLLLFFLVLVMIICGWEAISYFVPGLHFVLPPPSHIAVTLWERSDRFAFHTWATVKEMLGGAALAFLFAFPMAWGMSLFRPMRVFLQPLFVIIQGVPMFVLAPLMVIWFGWSYAAIVISTALMIFFPLTVSIYQGLCATPQHLLDFFSFHAATRWQTLIKLQLPWGMPHLFSGLRICAALAGIGAVAGEWAGAQEGLGMLMLESRRAADLETTFGALICLSVVSLLFYGATVCMEKKMQNVLFGQIPQKMVHVLFLCSCLLFCTGCHEQSKDGKIRLVLDWLPNPNHVAIYAGIEEGFFADQGIPLEVLKVPDPSDSIPYLTSRQADLCLTYMPHTLHSMAQGATLEPIAVLIQQPLNGIIYRTGEGITKHKDLDQKIIGYAVDGYSTAFLDALLQPNSIVPKEKRNVSFDLVSTLATKQVDAVYGAYWNIECENLRALGIDTSYFSLSEMGCPPYYELIFLANADSKEASAVFIKAFQQSMQASIDFAAANPEKAFNSYLKANPDKSAKVQYWEKQAWARTIPVLAKSQHFDNQLWNTFVDWLLEKELLKTDSPRLLYRTF